MKTERYAIRDPKTKKFLRVFKGSYARRREWVDDIEKATIWTRKGDASNAWLCAWELKQVKNHPVEVVTLGIAVTGVDRRIKVGTVTESGLYADGSGQKWSRKRRAIVEAR